MNDDRLVGMYGDNGHTALKGLEWIRRQWWLIVSFLTMSVLAISTFLIYYAVRFGTSDLTGRMSSSVILYVCLFLNFAHSAYELWEHGRNKPDLSNYYNYKKDVKRFASLLGYSVEKIIRWSYERIEGEIAHRLERLLNRVKGQVKPDPTCPKIKKYWHLYRDLYVLARKFNFRVCIKFPNPLRQEAFSEFVEWCHRHPNASASDYWKESDKPTEVER